MNSMLIYVLISCLIVVTVQQSRAEIRPKRSEPPMKKTHPVFWNGRREFYLQSKNVWYIQIGSNGSVSGSKSPTEAAVIQMISGTNQTVALKGKLADKYLCMNSHAIVYANASPDETDCFFVENFNKNYYNTYHHSFHRRGDLKNYLSIDDDGIIRVGNRTNEVQIYFLPVDVNSSTRVKTTTTTANPTLPTAVKPTLPTSTVAPIKRKLERTRKRRRRWCKLLIKGRLERNPQKYKKRCKHDCNILKIMLDNPKRYKRKCDKQRQRRRRRNRKKYSREYGPNHRRRHHHGDKSKKRTRNRGRRREPKRTTVKSPITPRTHNIDVT